MRMTHQAIDGQTRVKRRSRITFTKIDDELIGLDGRAGWCYSLNEVASALWRLIEMETTVDALCENLRKTFVADEATVRHDVVELLAELSSMGLVEVWSSHDSDSVKSASTTGADAEEP